MSRDFRSAVLDLVMTISFIVLAIASRWWWAMFAVGSGYIAYRQMLLVSGSAHGPGEAPR